MKKIGLKIYLNDKLISISGIDTAGTVSQILTLRNDSEGNEQTIKLHSGGYLKEKNEHYKWVDQELTENDRVTIEVVEDVTFDDPLEIKPHDNPELNAFVLKSKLKSYYQLKEELKDHLKD